MTDAQIQELKKRHRVFRYVVKEKECYLRNPDLKILDACYKVGSQSHIKFNEILLQLCWLDGDEEIRTNAEYTLGLFDKLSEIIVKAEGELGEC